MRGWPTVPMIDPARLITLPVGEPGSGRIRYGAAMALFRRGRLPEAALEVYRICASLDHQDPVPLLHERGLAAPAPVSRPAEAEIRALLAEAAAYLATLPGDGALEVRAGLARWSGGALRPVEATGGAGEAARLAALLEEHLPVALTALGETHPALAARIEAAAPHLDWRAYGGYPPDRIGAGFAAGHAYASLFGDGPIPAEDFDFGLFLIAPGLLYRDHRHLAPELYAPLTGPHGWRFGPGRPLMLKSAHEPVWNDPMVPHLIKVGALPFLCLYGWTRDVDALAEVVDALDWDELEAMPL